MQSKQTKFYAILSDISPIIKKIEDIHELHYFKIGLFENKITPEFISIFETSGLGIDFFGDWNRSDSYLLLPKELNVNIREVPQRSMGSKFAVDQMINPQSIEIKLGGIYKENGNVLIPGRVATISEDPFAIDLYETISTLIKKEFKKFGEFYVGKSAELKLKSGWRLVTNEKLAKTFDLK